MSMSNTRFNDGTDGTYGTKRVNALVTHFAPHTPLSPGGERGARQMGPCLNGGATWRRIAP